MLKKCFKCGVEKVASSHFYPHPAMGDGYLGKCKECTRRDVRLHRAANVARVRAYDCRRAKTPERKAANVDRARWERLTRPDKTKAWNALRRAVNAGRMTRPDRCQRCDAAGKPHAHHDDHARPFDVMWLCPACHAARHVELGRVRRIAQ